MQVQETKRVVTIIAENIPTRRKEAEMTQNEIPELPYDKCEKHLEGKEFYLRLSLGGKKTI